MNGRNNSFLITYGFNASIFLFEFLKMSIDSPKNIKL